MHRDADSQALGAWRREVGDQILSFSRSEDGVVTDKSTGSTWDLLSGRSTAGELKGQILKTVFFIPSYWFSWRDFFPKTTIYDKLEKGDRPDE